MKRQDIIISEFIVYLTKTRSIPFQIICWPDKLNRSSKDIDAIAEGDDIRIAIEHTTIDTVNKQREDSDRFMKVFKEIETHLFTKVADKIRLTVDFYVVQNKINWQKLQQTLKDWLEKNIPTLPFGSAYHNIPNIPFKVHINKQASINPSFRIGRFPPENKTLPKRIASSISRKMEKLAPYKKKGYKTFLLIENNDIALMSLALLKSSVKIVMKKKLVKELDEIWYADTSIPNDLEFQVVWAK